jgi:predicted transcriptional regulator
MSAPPRLHELESEVMEALWAAGKSSVRQVMVTLNAGDGRERAYTTYMTIMARLHRKGMLERRREGKTDFYTPAYARDEYMRLRAGAEVDGLVKQYGDAALTQFAQHIGALDPARRRALQRLARKS